MNFPTLGTLLIAMLPVIGSADTLILTKERGPVHAKNVPSKLPPNVRVLDMSGSRSTYNDDQREVLASGFEPSSYPAVIDRESGTVVCGEDVGAMLALLPSKIAENESNTLATAQADAGTNYVAAIVDGDAQLDKAKNVADLVAYLKTLRAALAERDAADVKPKRKEATKHGK